MKLKDIVLLSAEMCNADLPDFYREDGADLTGDKTVEKLVACANSVIDEIACEYVPLTEKGTLVSTDGFAPLSDGKSVVSLRKSGARVGFTTASGGVYVPDGEYEAVFAVRPPKVSVNGNVTVGSALVSERIIALGTAAEYFLLQGNYGEAQIWSERFNEAMENVRIKRITKRMPKRRWL